MAGKATFMTPAKEDTVAAKQVTDQSLSELVQQLSNQTSTLVRKEIQLAQQELQNKGKRAGLGVGLLGGGGLLALYAVGALIAAAVLGLATAVASWLAALIVAVALFVIAGVLALLGKKQVQRAMPPKPETAIESVQSDIAEVKERAGRK
jgi:Flp pilus assembly protein TadB